MNGKQQNERIIFGLKVRQLRQKAQLSFSDFAARTGMSVSYLNEIEKGKKFPKEDKIEIIAAALKVPSKDLLSAELPPALAPVEDLLQSNFLNELPLDLFGVELTKVVEMIAGAPSRVGAFISTLVDLSRNYTLAEENFYFGALRAYLEMHNNYFEELEDAAAVFAKKYEIPVGRAVEVSRLRSILEEVFNYTIEDGGLDDIPELKKIRSVYLPEKKKLLLNSSLSDMQKAFQFAKELGFNHLKLKDRALTSSLIRVKTFEEVLNHFKAGYFAAALLMNRETLVKDLDSFFSKSAWDGEALMNLMKKYEASPEMLFQRMTNLLPKYLGLKDIFLLRFIQNPATDSFKMDRELHLNRRHRPHGTRAGEHYCRRWLSYSLLSDLQKMQASGKFAGTIIGAQLSRYFDTPDEYLCFTIARPASPAQNVSVTLGILVEPKMEKTIRFLQDASISRQIVNTTCERCPIKDCAERVAPPGIFAEKESRKEIQKALERLRDSR